MEAFLVSITTIAVAEIGDRTQLLSLVLAARYRRPWPIIAGILCSTLANHALAGVAADEESFAVHGQFTYIEQETSGFNAPYRGVNSLSPNRGAETSDATLYLGAKPWSGAEAWIDAELEQGFGLGDTLGAAGFPSGEAYKVGRNQPYSRLQRAFVRQTAAAPAPL
jgi:hypothetical protein